MPQQQRKATEAAYIEQGTELSTSSKGEDVTEHCEDIARKIFKLITNENNINTQQITFKDEKSGEWMKADYNNESFPGEYSFRWESGVEGPLNAASKQQKALALLDTLANISRLNPQVTQKINWTELLRSTLTSFDIKNLEEILTPEEMPMGQVGMEGQQMGAGGQPTGQQVTPEILEQILGRLRGGQ